MTSISSHDLQQVVNKIEHLEDQKKDISEEIKLSYKDAESLGFDVKTLRKIIKIRKQDKDKLAEEEELLEVYRRALNI